MAGRENNFRNFRVKAQKLLKKEKNYPGRPIQKKYRRDDSMAYSNFRNKIEHELSSADIKIGGDRPWDIQVHTDDFYARLLAKGSLGLGESYMDGWWVCYFFSYCKELLKEEWTIPVTNNWQ